MNAGLAWKPFGQGSFIDPATATPQQVEARRRLLERLQPRYGTARFVGEGLGHLATGILAGLRERQLSKVEADKLKEANDLFARIADRASAIPGGFSVLGPLPVSAAPPAAPVDPNAPDVLARDTMKALGRAPEADAQRPAGFGGDMDRYAASIARIESGGDYRAVGPRHPRLGRALGKYQVMEANVGPWTRKHFGRELSPEEFLASPEAQEAVFRGEFGSYVERFGPEGAAQAWFGGPGGVGKVDRKDSLGTSIGDYGRKFMAGLGEGGAPAGMPVTARPAWGTADEAQIVAALGNPWLSPEQRAALMDLLNQSRSAPMRALEMERARLELERMGDPAPGYRPATPDEAAAYGAVAGQFGPDGRFYPINPPSGMSVESDGQGGFRIVQGPGVAGQLPPGSDPSQTATPREPARLARNLSDADAKLIERERELARAASDLSSIATQMEVLAPNLGYTGPFGRAYGWLDDMTGFLPGDSGARGAFRSLTTEAQLTFTEKTKGAITDREMATFKEAVPSLDRTPEANAMIANVLRAGAQRVQSRAAFMEAYAAAHGSLEGAQDAWRAYMEANPIIARGKNGIEVRPEGDWRPYIAGGAQHGRPEAAAPGRILTYNPETGELE